LTAPGHFSPVVFHAHSRPTSRAVFCNCGGSALAFSGFYQCFRRRSCHFSLFRVLSGVQFLFGCHSRPRFAEGALVSVFPGEALVRCPPPDGTSLPLSAERVAEAPPVLFCLPCYDRTPHWRVCRSFPTSLPTHLGTGLIVVIALPQVPRGGFCFPLLQQPNRG